MLRISKKKTIPIEPIFRLSPAQNVEHFVPVTPREPNPMSFDVQRTSHLISNVISGGLVLSSGHNTGPGKEVASRSVPAGD
jgi:hypothetical protein